MVIFADKSLQKLSPDPAETSGLGRLNTISYAGLNTKNPEMRSGPCQFILIGIFVVFALIALGQKFPHLQPYRWLIVIPVILAAILISMVKIVPPGHVGILILSGKFMAVLLKAST